MTKEFFEAIRAGDAASVREMLRRDRTLANAKTEAGDSAVIVAKLRGQAAVLQEILAANPTLDIHEAAYLGDAARARQLLEADDALLESFSSDGFTPLDLASYFGHRDLVTFLLERGAKVEHEIRNENLFTALTGAVAEGHLQVAKLLLDLGANVNHRYAEGSMPLITAAANGDADMVQLLLAHGADPNAANDEGKRAIDVAAERGHGVVVMLLRNRTAAVTVDREDPMRVSPETYGVEAEGGGVRVLVETLPPGGSAPRHRHPDHVLVAISGGRIALRSVHGRVETHEMEPGDALVFPGVVHEVENVGAREWRAAIVEFRPAE